MDRSPKLINLFVSETRESACICITIVIDIVRAVQRFIDVALFCPDISKDSISLLRIPVFSHVQV